MRFSRFILKYILLIFLVLGNPLRGGSCTEGGTDYSANVSYCQWTCGASDCCAYYSRDFDGDGWGWQPAPTPRHAARECRPRWRG